MRLPRLARVSILSRVRNIREAGAIPARSFFVCLFTYLGELIMQIEGIPEGWELVRVGSIRRKEFYLNTRGIPIAYENCNESTSCNHVIIRKIPKQPQYRPFANAAEFAPHRDRWIRRSYPDRQEAKGCFRVSSYNDCMFWHGGNSETYQEAFEDGRQFDDGTPFGVEVTE